MQRKLRPILAFGALAFSFSTMAYSATSPSPQNGKKPSLNIDYKQLNYDYRDYWGLAKNQENLRSCHIFATDALVEAEYARSFGEKISLSDANLFLQFFLRAETKTIAEESIKTIFAESTAPGIISEIDDDEGGYFDYDFSLLKKIGLKSDRELPYKKALRFMGDLSYAVWLISMENRTDQAILKEKEHTAYEGFLKQEKDILDAVYVPPKVLSKENDWLQKLNLKTSYLIEQSIEEKKEKIIKALACKPVGVLIDAELYEFAHGGHALVLAGYIGRSNEFIVRNSWGLEGFFFSSYEKIDADKFLNFTNAYIVIDNPDHPCPGT